MGKGSVDCGQSGEECEEWILLGDNLVLHGEECGKHSRECGVCSGSVALFKS